MRVPVGVLLLVSAAAGCTTTVERVDPAWSPEYQIESAVDPESATMLGGSAAAWEASGAAAPVSGMQDPAGRPVPQGMGDEEAAALRARFGSNILIKPDGTITKDYFLSKESGGVLLRLLKVPGGADFEKSKTRPVDADHGSMMGRMLRGHRVDILFLENFETPTGLPIRAPVSNTAPGVGAQGSPNSLVLVTAKPDGVAAFESALDMFFGNIPQVEIEVKVVEYSTSNSLGIGVDVLDAMAGTPPTLDQMSSKKLISDITSRFPLSPPILGVGSGAERGLITLGGIHDNWALNAELQLLEARGIADIVSNPKMVVRNGGLASVSTTTDLPYPKARIASSGQNITASITFKPVGIGLHIRPVIAGTETIILQVFARVAAVTSFAATTPVPTPVISSREVLTSVHVTNGKTTVIGGLVSQSRFENVSKFPVLGDIPILGYLFRSSLETIERTTLEFHITPRIIQGNSGFQGGG